MSGSVNCIGELILGLGQLCLALVGFLVVVRFIEWPEKAIRWIIRRVTRESHPGKLPTPDETPRKYVPRPPQYHKNFDEPV